MKGRLTIERALLVAIVLLQVTHIGVDLWRERRSAPVRVPSAVVQADEGRGVYSSQPAGAEVNMATNDPAVHPVDAMNVMMVHAMRDLERMSSIVIREERWSRLGAEPTMDMRERERDYLVAVGLPRDVDPSLLVVDLEGRRLTITARRAPVNPLMSGSTIFERHVQLPGAVGREEEASAAISNGVLRISLPKVMPSQPEGSGIRRRLF
jgi:HSP20 family molecular chaperone IbpA